MKLSQIQLENKQSKKLSNQSTKLAEPKIDEKVITKVVADQISELNNKHIQEMSKLRKIIEDQTKQKEQDIERLVKARN